jgi:hypothetical protein
MQLAPFQVQRTCDEQDVLLVMVSQLTAVPEQEPIEHPTDAEQVASLSAAHGVATPSQ